MAIKTGLNIPSDGLIFAVDMNNSKKSWQGEPTTNRIPTPTANARFTTSNGWYTYNTNQYNSNNYFSIGTISSVSNNIVTTSSNHPFRTFDVVNPQSGGGGLTAGQDYLVKKISNTQFSLHSYNSNQTGSQGYLMTNGFHKVHESIANDTKVSINSTSFPTMWKGDPHLPNSHIVKDVHTSGGPDNQSFMRLHLNSLHGVSDGMAYGVNVPVTANDTINVSFYARQSPWTAGSKSCTYTTYFGPGNAAGSFSFTPTAEWQKFSHQWTASVTYNFIQYFFPNAPATGVPYYVDLCDLQVETNTESGDTPFTLSSRSTTEALVDMTGNHTITSSLDYETDGTFTFSDSSDYATVTGDIATIKGDITMSGWVNLGSRNGPHQTILAQSLSYRSGMTLMSAYHGHGPAVWIGNSDGTGDTLVTAGSSNAIENAGITHVAATRNSSNGHLRLYVNGAVASSGTGVTGNLYNTTSVAQIGREYHSSGYGHNGPIYNILAYNRVLSDDEIKDIYEAQRITLGV